MHGPHRTLQTWLRARCRRICGAALGSARLSRLPWALTPRQGAAARSGEAMPRGRQRAAAAVCSTSAASGMEVRGRCAAREERAAGRGVHLSDRAGLPSEQSKLVCGDLAQARKAPGFRHRSGAGLPTRGLSKKRCAYSVSRSKGGLYSSVSRSRERSLCSVSRCYSTCFGRALYSVSRRPSRDAISCTRNHALKGTQ